MFRFDYEQTPSDLILYYKFTEGGFKNKGSGGLVYILNSQTMQWTLDSSLGPKSCKENQYYDSLRKECLCKILNNKRLPCLLQALFWPRRSKLY